MAELRRLKITGADLTSSVLAFTVATSPAKVRLTTFADPDIVAEANSAKIDDVAKI